MCGSTLDLLSRYTLLQDNTIITYDVALRIQTLDEYFRL